MPLNVACHRVAVGVCLLIGAIASSAISAAELRPASAAAPTVVLPLLPADRPAADVVDHYIDGELQRAKTPAAPQVDDAVLVRRLTLDLAGRTPTPVEVREFVESRDPKKRALLVDRLLASPEFVDHMVNEFDWMLMQGQGSVREYLTAALTDRRSWDQIFRDLMLVETAAAPPKGATEFLKLRMRDHDRLTNDVSSLFFGVNISCAQCHDHPLAKDWTQDHFFGLKSFFARSFENGGFIGERDYGLVSYQTPKGEARQAKLMFLSGRMVDEPKRDEPDGKAKKAEQDMLKQLADKKQAPPKPKFSRRAALVETALRPDQRHLLARSIVNRLWHRLLGQGLVMPVDQMHSGNPASHPQLLEWLARDVADHGFDWTRTIRAVVMSRTYSRSSRWESAAPRPQSHLFAVAQVRPLSPYQYAAALRIATTDPQVWTTMKWPEGHAARARGIAGGSRSMASFFAPLVDDFQVGVGESLLMNNEARIQTELLADGGDRLVGRLKGSTDVQQQVDVAVQTVLGRAPAADELKLLGDYLAERKDRPIDAVRQVVWSLVTGSEFRFNY